LNNKKNDTEFENFELLKENLKLSGSNLLFYHDAFSKIKLIQKIINLQSIPILYVDFDLLFSGYVNSKQITQTNLSLFNILETEFNEIMTKLLTEISLKPHFVIFDSVNGLYNALSNDDDSGRTVNSILMLLARNISFSKSILLIPVLAEKKDEKWIMPNGRQILENENVKKFSISDRSKIFSE
tara:strand:+ start:1899 stop:2450 length:552 start_codon:yes stop_codon:yes gene_type:complete